MAGFPNVFVFVNDQGLGPKTGRPMRVIKIMLLVAAYFCSVAHAEPSEPEMTAGTASELPDDSSIPNACSQLTQFEDNGCSAPNISLSELSKLLTATGLSGMSEEIVPTPSWIPDFPLKPGQYGDGPCAPLQETFARV